MAPVVVRPVHSAGGAPMGFVMSPRGY